MNVYPKNKLPNREVKKFVIIFYTVGVAGFLIPFTHNFFVTITPFALLLSTYLLLVYDENCTRKSLIVYAAIALLGFIIEVVGIHTGLIFGDYAYGNALGFKLFDTPLLIALNWMFLTYATFAIAVRMSSNVVAQLILAPTFMLVYDTILEQLAPTFNMWSWESLVVPTQNYVAWWCISLVFVAIMKYFIKDVKNDLATVLFFSQFGFFVVLHFALMILA